VLAITGGEALYADMGHFGARPIRLSWFGLVLPALVLSYLGQGSLVLRDPSALAHPFFAMVPGGAATYALVGLAAMATTIASQALITGVFSLTHQAVQLGFFPRVTIVHTAHESEGQIFVPEVNTALAVACVGLVLGFKESSALAAAYGIAVTGTMAITSIVYFVVLRQTWQWPLWRAVPLVVMFLSFDLPFFGANALKFFSGGWFPVAAAIGIFLVMTTWKKGRALLGRNIAGRLLPIDVFIADVEHHKAHRVPGTAVFMASNPHGVPIVLLHHWKHNQVLHQAVVFLSIASEAVPEIRSRDRLTASNLGHGFYQITARYGFMQTPNVPQIMEAAKAQGVPYEPGRTSYFLGRETLLTTGDSKMFRWRKALFSFISRNARSATQYFGIPPDRVVELGMQINL
jgi:KUP system potassium uptake protein